MAHPAQFNFCSHVKNMLPDFFKASKVLEAGSLNINGTIRTLFDLCDYTGIDIGPGPCVDFVAKAHEYDGPSDYFDVVCSCEMFEHDPHWEKSFNNMVRLCKTNGLVLFSCATTGRAKHGTLYCEPHSSPNTVDLGWEYYRNLTEKFL